MTFVEVLKVTKAKIDLKRRSLKVSPLVPKIKPVESSTNMTFAHLIRHGQTFVGRMLNITNNINLTNITFNHVLTLYMLRDQFMIHM